MSRVRSKQNRSTELALIRIFRDEGITGWRRGYRLFGSPDFVFPKLRVAVFVDGCFWHGCPKHASIPVSNRAYWEAKLQRNKNRDRQVTLALRAAGWGVIRIWECNLRLPKRTIRVLMTVSSHNGDAVHCLKIGN
jgi:DNA mismatch endonuclease (patch repair protein)